MTDLSSIPPASARRRDGEAPQAGASVLSLTALFREWFGLRPSEAATLCVLFQARGRLLPALQIAAEVDATEATLRRANIPRLRQAMETEAIDTADGGYRLSEIGLEECQAVILAAGEAFARLGQELGRAG